MLTQPRTDGAEILARYRRAKSRRVAWEAGWRDCYDYALPQRDTGAGDRRSDRLFDGTAPDAVDQLAASLLAQLTPPWSRWIGLAPGTDVQEAERGSIAAALEQTSARLMSHFNRSNFTVEAHQCYLDLATAGTAVLLFEEAPLGEPSAFRFQAVPLLQVAIEESASGRCECVFRRAELRAEELRARYPEADLPADLAVAPNDEERRASVIEAVLPQRGGYRYVALLEHEQGAAGAPCVLRDGWYETSPFIVFRWLKAPGEAYGRSPVMKALPDIKTANKIVELVLKNASIAVTGIWQADDDGVLNPATIKLVPGTIIPKAVGSAGLTPLEAPGRFDISALVLDDMRKRIRHALLVDRLGPVDSPRMTATEVLERSGEMARILGATYGRLQSELLTPLIDRALAILGRRGEAPAVLVDGRIVELQYQSPLARMQAREDVRNTLLWIGQVAGLGPQAAAAVDIEAAARWIGRALNVPGELIREPSPTLADLADLALAAR